MATQEMLKNLIKIEFSRMVKEDKSIADLNPIEEINDTFNKGYELNGMPIKHREYGFCLTIGDYVEPPPQALKLGASLSGFSGIPTPTPFFGMPSFPASGQFSGINFGAPLPSFQFPTIDQLSSRDVNENVAGGGLTEPPTFSQMPSFSAPASNTFPPVGTPDFPPVGMPSFSFSGNSAGFFGVPPAVPTLPPSFPFSASNTAPPGVPSLPFNGSNSLSLNLSSNPLPSASNPLTLPNLISNSADHNLLEMPRLLIPPSFSSSSHVEDDSTVPRVTNNASSLLGVMDSQDMVFPSSLHDIRNYAAYDSNDEETYIYSDFDEEYNDEYNDEYNEDDM